MNLAMLLDLPAMIAPDQVILDDERDSHTFHSLHTAVQRLARSLSAKGVTHGDRVGLFATNRLEGVEVVFAAAFVGATVVPMNFRARKDEAAHLLADSGVRVLFTESRYLELIESVRPDTLEHLVVLDDDLSVAEFEKGVDPGVEDFAEMADVDDKELAVLLYTSGTTSLPKGVMLTHGALSGYVMNANDAADGEEHGRSLLAAPLYHVAGLTSLLNALYSGRRTFMLPQFEAGAWLDAVAKHRITNAFLVPTMLARILDHPALASADLSTLENITYGAAPMPPSVIRRAIEVFPPNVGFSGAYGQTETTSTVAVLDPDDHRIEGTDEEKQRKLKRLSSVGRAVGDVELRVVSSDGAPLGANEEGEVQLRTPRTMTGYWGAQEKTRVTVDAEGWVHTGDLGYIDEDGYVFLTGRSGDMIIRGGENIAPAEIEQVLYEHPEVLEAAVVGIPDEEWGERVVAATVLREGSSVSEGDLLEFLRPRLASFKRPERVLVLDELPRTSTGKLVRRDLVPIVSDAVKA